MQGQVQVQLVEATQPALERPYKYITSSKQTQGSTNTTSTTGNSILSSATQQMRSVRTRRNQQNERRQRNAYAAASHDESWDPIPQKSQQQQEHNNKLDIQPQTQGNTISAPPLVMMVMILVKHTATLLQRMV
jgi:hypothetical protein